MNRQEEEIPKKIYLQLEDKTWCVDKINDDDIEYVLASDRNLLSKEISEKDVYIKELQTYIAEKTNNGSHLQQEIERLKPRCESAEVLLKKYYKRIPDCAELITWHELAEKGSTQALADYQKEESCDAMGHYGGDKPEGICPKCNKSW